MKKLFCVFFAVISIVAVHAASVWEGAAEFSPELPEKGLFLATNSFPVNSVVDVTNLENGKIARLIVSARLDGSGFLALLSKEAADSLGLQDNTLGRIRMSQNSDPFAFSRFQPEVKTITPVSTPDYHYSLVPSEPRPPEKKKEVEIPFKVSVIETLPVSPIELAPVQPFRIESPMITPSREFSSCMIYALERGKFYVQIAAYSKVETVKKEISKIDANLPVAIMNAGSDDKPIYRILIGPMNQGESGPVLQRFKADYKDAFVRQGL